MERLNLHGISTSNPIGESLALEPLPAALEEHSPQGLVASSLPFLADAGVQAQPPAQVLARHARVHCFGNTD